MIFEEQFLVPRYTAARKIANSVISLLWQLRCCCNPDHNKFPSSSNTTVLAIFPKLCLWRRSLCSNLGGIGPEKLYRATLNRNFKTNLKPFYCLRYDKMGTKNADLLQDRIDVWLVKRLTSLFRYRSLNGSFEVSG